MTALHLQLHPEQIGDTTEADRNAQSEGRADLHHQNTQYLDTRILPLPATLPAAELARPFVPENDTHSPPSAPGFAPDRPVALRVKPENIPAEMKARDAWVVWRYELDKRGKWTKMPYIAGTTSHAKSNTKSTWRSFAEALACYHERPDYFDGIGFCPSKHDPFVLGDIDHSQDADRLPPTYAENSPGGGGLRWVAIASGNYHTKRPNGELYSYSQFMTITGHVLPGHEHITDCQAEVEAFAASLGTSTRKASGGSANGSRAELVKAIPESEWEAGRQLIISGAVDQVVSRVKAAAGEETQLALLLRGDYAEFNRRWPFVGLYRADNTLDTSQVRAIAARGIKGRGFTFAEYAAVMHRLYAAEALAKWGSKELWRQELAALWEKSPTPRFQWQPRPAPKAKRTPRGRAGNHAALVEQVYGLLLEHRAGDEAIVTASQIAGVIYCARETVSRILGGLRDAGRIKTERRPRHGGLLITFLDVIYSPAAEAVSPQPSAPNPDPPAAAPEETEITPCVSSDRATDDHSLPTLAELAAYYLDQRPADVGQRYVQKGSEPLLDVTTGEIKVTRPARVLYRRTAKHFAGLVVAEYPYTTDQAIEAYAVERERRKVLAAEEWQRFFVRLRAMSDDDLIAYVGGRCRAEVAEMARDGLTFDKHLYSVRLKCAKQHLSRRGLAMPAKKTRIEQAARDAAKEAQQARQRLKGPRLVACQPIRYEQPPAPVVEPWRSPADLALLGSLFARKGAPQGTA